MSESNEEKDFCSKCITNKKNSTRLEIWSDAFEDEKRKELGLTAVEKLAKKINR